MGTVVPATALVLGADVVILLSLEALAGGEMELAAAVRAEEQTGEQALPFRLGGTASVFSELLYPFPLQAARKTAAARKGCCSWEPR